LHFLWYLKRIDPFSVLRKAGLSAGAGAYKRPKGPIEVQTLNLDPRRIIMQKSQFNFSSVEIQTIADNMANEFSSEQEGKPKEHPMACCCCSCCAVVTMPQEE